MRWGLARAFRGGIERGMNGGFGALGGGSSIFAYRLRMHLKHGGMIVKYMFLLDRTGVWNALIFWRKAMGIAKGVERNKHIPGDINVTLKQRL